MFILARIISGIKHQRQANNSNEAIENAYRANVMKAMAASSRRNNEIVYVIKREK